VQKLADGTELKYENKVAQLSCESEFLRFNDGLVLQKRKNYSNRPTVVEVIAQLKIAQLLED